MPQVHAFLTNCRLADGRVVDIGIAAGRSWSSVKAQPRRRTARQR
jgi:hypothetical protein